MYTAPKRGFGFPILNGWIDRDPFQAGLIDTTLPFEEARERSRINDAARRAEDGEDLPERIRASLPSAAAKSLVRAYEGAARVKTRTVSMAGFTVLCVVAAVALPPVAQPLEYHDFADQRGAFGVPHFLNVVSNIGFLVAGMAGLAVVGRRRTTFERGRERWPFAVLFVGVLLTAAGSTYYHLAPDNERLFWDRLPMTIAFMALVASQIVDRISVRVGLALLAPMLLLGAATVVYWRATERVGGGNVLPYAILQGYAVLVLLLLAWLYPSRYTRGEDLYFVFGWYVLSKVLEALDAPVFSLGQVVSGHTLKHLAAATAGGVACCMLVRRTLRAREAPGETGGPGSRSPAGQDDLLFVDAAGLREQDGDRPRALERRQHQ